MKKALLYLLASVTLLGVFPGPVFEAFPIPVADAAVRVRGYTRKDGTYVQPHYRSSPDGNPYNNYSYPGNYNPYTGKVAPGNPNTYLRNYYGRSGGTSLPYIYLPSPSYSPTIPRITIPTPRPSPSPTLTASPSPSPTPPSNCASVVSAQPIVEDDFNSYANGSIVGQGGWVSYVNGDHFVVQGDTVSEGAKAVRNNSFGDSVAGRYGTPRADGKQSVRFRTENRDNWGFYSADGNAGVRVSDVFNGSIFASVSLKKDGYVAYYDPVADVYINFATYNDNEWTLLEIEWRSSDKTARYRVNNGAWTDWKTFRGAASFTNFSFVHFGFVLPSGSGGVYFDALGQTLTDCPERLFGLYFPSDPSPVDNPNLDCPERAFGLHCPDDPSPVENPNLDPVIIDPSSDGGGGGGGGGGDGGGGGGGEEPQPEPQKKMVKPKVKGKAVKHLPKVRGASIVAPLYKRVNALHLQVYGRNPTLSENRYWLSRIKDKPTEQALNDAMLFHKLAGVSH